MMRIHLISLFLFLGIAYAEETKVLKWGGDSSGGVPFVLYDPKDLSKLVGFEVEVAGLIAAELGMKAEFDENQWEGLVPGLKAGNYDVIINAMEITEDRREEIDFSIPYFYSFEQMTLRKDQFDINTLQDLKGRKAGTSTGALAERILAAHGGIEVLAYGSQTTIYDDLANGRLDAALLDQPAALYYAGLDSRLKNIEKSFGEFSYGVGVRKEDKALLNKINLAIKKLIQTGQLRHIYERWGVWNSIMAEQFKDNSPVHYEPVEYKNYLQSMGYKEEWKILQYAKYLPSLAKGALTTLEVSIVSMIFAMLLGLFIALVRLYAPRPFPTLMMVYVEFMRGTPLLIQLFFIYYGLPTLGIKLDPFIAAVLGLALNYSAYESEIYRAGIMAIPKGQSDAAFALGMNRMQNLRHIILPQSMPIVIPMMTNDFISLLKDSSLVSVITMVELTRVYGQLASTYYDYLGIGFLTAIIYLLIGLPIVRFARVVEVRLNSKLHQDPSHSKRHSFA